MSEGPGWSPRAVAGELVAVDRRLASNRRAGLLIVAVAVVVLGLGVSDLLDHYGIGVGSAVAVSLLRAAALLTMLRRPVAGWWLTVAACAATTVVTTDPDLGEPWPWSVSSALALAAAFFVLTTVVRRATSVVAWAAVQLAGLAVGAALSPSGTSATGSFFGTLVLTGLAVVAGDAVSGRRRARRRLVEAERESVLERERRTLLEERSRIARDLHDVVAHHMSVITVQADSAAYRLPGLDRRVEDEFATIAGGCRTALAELRRMLEMLRTGPDGAEIAPHAGLSGLASLAENVRRVGVAVRMRIEPGLDGAGLPAEIELTAYRIVQEALSNVVRHASGAEVEVSLRRRDGALHVDVVNGAGRTDDPVEPSGQRRGLAGMWERLELIGGSMRAAETDDGGFAIHAVLPLPEETQ